MQTVLAKMFEKRGDGILPKVACLCLTVGLLSGTAWANPIDSAFTVAHQTVPILGVAVNQQSNPIGVVVPVHLIFEERQDATGLQVRFHERPGKFSPLTQRAVRSAIRRAAEAAGLQPSSWTITLIFPYEGFTLYGESLSAMVGLSVVALAKGDPLAANRVLTGTITAEGQIGKVGGVPYKIQAAYGQHFQRVLIPEEQDASDGDWHTPFLMQVSPVGTVSKAYLALTDRPL